MDATSRSESLGGRQWVILEFRTTDAAAVQPFVVPDFFTVVRVDWDSTANARPALGWADTWVAGSRDEIGQVPTAADRGTYNTEWLGIPPDSPPNRGGGRSIYLRPNGQQGEVVWVRVVLERAQVPAMRVGFGPEIVKVTPVALAGTLDGTDARQVVLHNSGTGAVFLGGAGGLKMNVGDRLVLDAPRGGHYSGAMDLAFEDAAGELTAALFRGAQ